MIFNPKGITIEITELSVLEELCRHRIKLYVGMELYCRTHVM